MDHGKFRGLSSKKRKQRRRNDYTSKSKEAKVGLTNEAIRSTTTRAKKIKSREEKGSVKVCELHTDNSDRCSQ